MIKTVRILIGIFLAIGVIAYFQKDKLPSQNEVLESLKKEIESPSAQP